MSDHKMFAVLREDGPEGEIIVREIASDTTDRAINELMQSGRWKKISASDRRMAVRIFGETEAERPARTARWDRNHIAAL